MKIKKSTRLVKVFKQVFNFRYWFDLDRVKAFTSYLVEGFQKMFVPQVAKKTETFDSAVKRMKLNPDELAAKQTALLRLSLLMCAVAGLIFGYAVYQFYYSAYKAVLISLVLMLIALVLAFRYHFWYFQIKERKLGCSLYEWYRQGIKGDKR